MPKLISDFFSLQELEAIKERVKAMEAEAEKLKVLQSEVEKQMNMGEQGMESMASSSIFIMFQYLFIVFANQFDL